VAIRENALHVSTLSISHATALHDATVLLTRFFSDGTEAEVLLELADARLYEMKKGRGSPRLGSRAMKSAQHRDLVRLTAPPGQSWHPAFRPYSKSPPPGMIRERAC